MTMVGGGASASRAPRISAEDFFQGSLVTRMAAMIRIIKAIKPQRCFLAIDME